MSVRRGLRTIGSLLAELGRTVGRITRYRAEAWWSPEGSRWTRAAQLSRCTLPPLPVGDAYELLLLAGDDGLLAVAALDISRRRGVPLQQALEMARRAA